VPDSWLSSWARPFLWLLLSPIATVSLGLVFSAGLKRSPDDLGLPTSDCEGDPDCIVWSYFFPMDRHYYEFVPTLLAFTLPGLLNLVPFWWAVSGTTTRARLAGWLAGLLGVGRFLVPTVVILTMRRVTAPDGKTYLEVPFLDPYLSVYFTSGLAWTVCLLAFLAVSSRWSERSGGRTLSGLTAICLLALMLLVGWWMVAAFR
jgi:hypothetical protein